MWISLILNLRVLSFRTSSELWVSETYHRLTDNMFYETILLIFDIFKDAWHIGFKINISIYKATKYLTP